MPDLDLSDDAVLAMVRRNHEPAEIWSVAGELLTVHCCQCNQSWPCSTVKRIREIDTRF